MSDTKILTRKVNAEQQSSSSALTNSIDTWPMALLPEPSLKQFRSRPRLRASHLKRLASLRNDRRLVAEMLQRLRLSFRAISFAMHNEGLTDV